MAGISGLSGPAKPPRLPGRPMWLASGSDVQLGTVEGEAGHRFTVRAGVGVAVRDIAVEGRRVPWIQRVDDLADLKLNRSGQDQQQFAGSGRVRLALVRLAGRQ